MNVKKCIFEYFKEHIFIFILSAFIIVLVTFLALLPPQILKYFVDDVLPNSLEDKKYLPIILFALYYMLLYVFINIVDFLKNYLLVIISQGIDKKVRQKMMCKIHSLSYNSLTSIDSGTLEAYFSNDVDEIDTLVTSGVISMVIDLFKMIGIIISIFIFSYIFGLMILLIVPLIIMFTMWIRKKMYKAQRYTRILEGKVNNQILENLDNMMSIKSFRIYSNVKEKYDQVLKEHFKSSQKASNYDAFFSPIIQVLKALIIILIITLSSVKDNLFMMSTGMIVSSIDLITDLFSPIENIGMELQTVQKSLAGIKRINEFFSFKEDEKKEEGKDIDLKNVELVYDDVSFRYEDDEKEVLSHFSYRLSLHDRVTFKGKSGSGKSTLFKLAYGLVKPTSGKVTINGIDTYLLSDKMKRRMFGIVYQDYYFTNGTIKDEITLLNENVSDEKIKEILKMVSLDRDRKSVV